MVENVEHVVQDGDAQERVEHIGRGADARLRPGDACILVVLQWRDGAYHPVGVRSAAYDGELPSVARALIWAAAEGIK